MQEQQPIEIAITHFGGVVAFARELGIKNYQTVQQWRKFGVPVEYAPAIERATNGKVTCEMLCPHVDWADRKYCPICEAA